MIDCKINKELEVGTKITFHLGYSLIDGTIIEKTQMDKGDISFKIETADGKLLIKHRNLNLYNINSTNND